MIWKIGVGRPLVYLDLVQMKSVGWEHGCWSWRQDCMRWRRIMSSTTALDREMLRRGLWDGENVKIGGVCEAEKGVSVATVCVCNHSACCLLNLHPSSSCPAHTFWLTMMWVSLGGTLIFVFVFACLSGFLQEDGIWVNHGITLKQKDNKQVMFTDTLLRKVYSKNCWFETSNDTRCKL